MVSTNALLASQNMLALLEEANHHTETILDELPSIFAIITEKGKIIRANQACCDLIDQSVDSVLHKNLLDFLDNENKAIFHYHFNKIKQDSLTQEVHFRADIASPNDIYSKKIIWNISTTSKSQRVKSSFDHKAYQTLYYITGEDCSSIYESETKLLSIFECLPLGIIILDKGGYIEEVLTHHTSIIMGKSHLKNEHFSDVFLSLQFSKNSDLKNSFASLISCMNQSSTFFDTIKKKIKNTFELTKKEKKQSSKWIRLHYQPIIKNNLIDKFMIIIKDDTESINLKNEKKRIDEIEKYSKALYESAIRDPLTGLYTRLYMDDGFNMLLNGFSFGSINAIDLVLFDIDNFKKINDTYGHSVGDNAISIVGKEILSHCTSGSIAIRYGGDEFLIMIPKENKDDHAGKFFSERVKSSLASQSLSIEIKKDRKIKNNITSICLSAGIITCKKGENITMLIERVDEYLYRAKKAGKNCIACEYYHTKSTEI